jgi:hypothetical protein
VPDPFDAAAVPASAAATASAADTPTLPAEATGAEVLVAVDPVVDGAASDDAGATTTSARTATSARGRFAGIRPFFRPRLQKPSHFPIESDLSRDGQTVHNPL